MSTHVKKIATCPRCGAVGCKRHSIRRKMKFGKLFSRSVHYCIDCRKHFTIGPVLRRRHPDHVRRDAVLAVIDKHMTLEKAAIHVGKTHKVKLAQSTIHDWVVEWRRERWDKSISASQDRLAQAKAK